MAHREGPLSTVLNLCCLAVQANVGEYEVSARYYTRALALNPSASSVWGYLRTSLACAGRMDLMAAVDNEDLPSLQEALPLI